MRNGEEPSGDDLKEQLPNRPKLDMQRVICEGLREKLRKIGAKGVNRSELLEEMSKISDFLARIWEE